MKPRVRISSLIIVAALVWSTAGAENTFPALTGYVRNYSGLFLGQDYEYAIIQNTLNLAFERRFGRVGFRVNPMLYQQVRGEIDLRLREAYVDIALRSLDMRVGRQQIIWGKAEGVFITDIVSPKDMREFLLPDFDEIRIGVEAVRLDYYLGMNTFELVVIPVFSPTLLPEASSSWAVEPDFHVQPTVDATEKEVALKAENGEVFARYSLPAPLVDFELMGGYLWDDEPTLHVRKEIDPSTRHVRSLTLTPKHHRLVVGGGSASTTIGDMVLRAEGAYYHGKYFQTTNPLDQDAVTEKDYVHYLVGADYTLWDTRLSAQFVQQAILDYESELGQDQFEHMLTLLARRDFLRETLTLEFFAYVGLNTRDALLRPRVSYEVSDGLDMLIGVNVFVGNEGRFGRYDDNDMVYVKTTYNF